MDLRELEAIEKPRGSRSPSTGPCQKRSILLRRLKRQPAQFHLRIDPSPTRLTEQLVDNRQLRGIGDLRVRVVVDVHGPGAAVTEVVAGERAEEALEASVAPIASRRAARSTYSVPSATSPTDSMALNSSVPAS